MTKQQWDNYVDLCMRLGEPIAMLPPEGCDMPDYTPPPKPAPGSRDPVVTYRSRSRFDSASPKTRFVMTKAQIIELVRACIKEGVSV